ncbi:MAG: hypothetical protein ABIG03_05905 [Candidatus Eisenbacteria bacterium]
MRRTGAGSDEGLLVDVARLNGILREGLSFAVKRGSAAAEERTATAVLELADAGGTPRRVFRRVRLARERRPRRLALSGCLAECAMELGLGASVCRRGTGESP